jgi:hypothetical protein
MRFITQFEIVPPAIEARLNAYKSRSEFELGQLIAQSFEWKNRGFIKTNNLAGLRYTLEIEAFPMDKWVEFKKRLFVHLGATGLYDGTFKDLISELESFRKPAEEKR